MQSLMVIFREVRDPRDPNARHELGTILFLALAATLCGAKSCVQIADFAEARIGTLREIRDLPHGVPSHDTFICGARRWACVRFPLLRRGCP